MRIFDPDTEGIGEILVKGPIVMQGYYENESATKEIFTEDGYLMTGDEGYLDKDNYLFLTGRKKTLIVTEGGKNVFPEEIEDKFQLYDEIEQILVRGFIKDKKMKTEDIEALVYPSKEYFNELEKKEKIKVGDQYIENKINTIIKEVNDDLVIYKKIKRVKILSESMEETTTRKIKRFKVKE
jgi:long-chain acyl-CoA synthetase